MKTAYRKGFEIGDFVWSPRVGRRDAFFGVIFGWNEGAENACHIRDGEGRLWHRSVNEIRRPARQQSSPSVDTMPSGNAVTVTFTNEET